MLIFAKKAFQFDHPAGQEPAVIVQAQSMTDVPDWVAESSMFKLASSDGDVWSMETKQDEKAAETGHKAKSASEKRVEEKALKEAEEKAASDSVETGQ